MKPNRRSFLTLMGIAPMAAKSAADAEIAKHAGIGINGLGDRSIMSNELVNLGGKGQSASNFVPWEQRPTLALKFLKQNGLPDVIESRYRQRAKSVPQLDPDIACKTTWSMSVKIMTQRERNYQALVDEIEAGTQRAVKYGLLEKLLGFEWPW